MAFPTASPPCFSNLHHHTGRYCKTRVGDLCVVKYASNSTHVGIGEPTWDNCPETTEVRGRCP